MSMSVYSMSIEQSLSTLGSVAETGLSEEIAASRLSQTGQGKQKHVKTKSFVLKILDQFKDTLILLLIAAATVSAITGGGLRDTVVIVGVLTISMTINIIVKNRVNKAIKELKNVSYFKARVKREGNIITVDEKNIVPGDIVMLSRGDRVPADIRLIESYNLQVDESIITGHPEPVKKNANALLDIGTPVGERYNIAYMGSTVTYGRGVGVVYGAGTETEIANKTTGVTGRENDTRTPLQDNLNAAAKTLGILGIIMCVLVFATGALYDIFEIGAQRGILQLLVISLSLTVAAVPKELGTHAAIILALGIQRMLKSKIIIKSFHSAITIGSTNVICVNKTGTLTENKMIVTQVADSENVYEVTGVGYKAKGHVIAEIMITRNIALMSEIVVLCNNAEYDKPNARITGNPTEGAMLVFGAKLGHDKQTLNAARPRIHEIPFDSTRKMMSTFNMDGDRVIMYTKGAAEEIINRSSYVYLDGEIVFMSDTVKAKLLAQSNEFASQALRVLACAYKVYGDESEIDNLENDLIYVGMMALADPLREQVLAAIKKCRASGVKIKIITGDHEITAREVARAFGIIKENDEVLSGNDLDRLGDEKLQAKVKTVNVFARVSPWHKLRIVNAIKADENNTVVVSGDDLDDIQALKTADIGISIGDTCSDIAKDAADVTVGDAFFISIVGAVERGRTIYANIRKTVTYILACNIGMLMLVLFVIACGLPLPLTATQLLFIYMLTGILPALALGTERKETGVLARRPKNPDESIINRKVISSCITRAIIIFISSLAAFLYGFYVAVAPKGEEQHILAMSMCFFTMTAGQLLVSYPAKTDAYMLGSRTMLKNRLLNVTVLLSLLILFAVIYLPGLGSMFTVIPLAADQIFICILIVLAAVLSVEISKLYAGT